jgi:ribulose-phosphate 3-epimerase
MTRTFFDVHLLMDNPADYIDVFAKAGADAINFHSEVTDNPEKLIADIKAHNCEAGIVFNPETELHLDASYVAKLDRVLIMTVHPGFGGQSFIDMSDKIQKAARIKHEHPHLNIVVDGGINSTTAPKTLAAGATTLVSGSALFSQKNNYAAAIAGLKGGQK